MPSYPSNYTLEFTPIQYPLYPIYYSGVATREMLNTDWINPPQYDFVVWTENINKENNIKKKIPKWKDKNAIENELKFD